MDIKKVLYHLECMALNDPYVVNVEATNEAIRLLKAYDEAGEMLPDITHDIYCHKYGCGDCTCDYASRKELLNQCQPILAKVIAEKNKQKDYAKRLLESNYDYELQVNQLRKELESAIYAKNKKL